VAAAFSLVITAL
jgi:hypothetical protein